MDNVLLGWAPGIDQIIFPNNIGILAGVGTQRLSLIIQVHYNNLLGTSGFIDNSGIRIFYTTKLRENSVTTLMSGSFVYLFYPDGGLPPGENAFYSTAACVVSSTTPMTGFAVLNHAYLLGFQIWSDLFRFNPSTGNVDKIAELGRDDAYSFNTQHFSTLNNIQMQPEDVISTACVYNSSMATALGGYSSFQEMCLAFILAYPDAGSCGLPRTHRRTSALHLVRFNWIRW